MRARAKPPGTLPPGSVGELGNKPAISDLWKDLELRFTNEGSVSSYYNILTLYGMQEIDTIKVPFEIWDVENEQRLNIAAYQAQGTTKPESAIWSVDSAVIVDSLFIGVDTTLDTTWVYGNNFNTEFQFIPVHTPYNTVSTTHYAEDTDLLGWVIYWASENSLFSFGDRLKIFIPNPIIPGLDTYTITTTEDNYSLSSGDLDQIKVVPNPYVVTSAFEQLSFVKEIQFTHLPAECAIRIFNNSGELVQLLDHSPSSSGYRGPSIEAWNLGTYNNQDIAFGVYVFHVVSNDGNNTEEFIGKFAVIK